MPKKTPDVEVARTLRDAYQTAYDKEREFGEPKKRQAEYIEAIRNAKAQNPDGFRYVQDTNTDARLAVLNQLDMEMDAYNDPVSRKGLEDLQFNLSVPYGFSTSDGKRYTLPGNGLATTRSRADDPRRGLVAVAEGMTDPEMQKNRMGLGGLLRHEAHHREDTNTPHDDVYMMDRLYLLNKGKSDKVLPRRYQREPTQKEMRRLMHNSAYNARQNNSGSDVIPEGASEQETYKWEEIANMSPEDKLNLIKSANNYNINTDHVYRDLPDKGMIDAPIAYVKRLLGSK